MPRAPASGDPHLAAVEDIAVALPLGAQPHRDDVGAGARLAHRQRADMLARDQVGQIFALLRVAAVAADLVDAEVRMGAVGEPDRGRGTAHLLHRDAMGEIAHPGAAIFLLDRDAVQAERAHLRPQLHREPVGLVDLGRERRNLLLGKIAHAAPQHIDLWAEIVIEHQKPGVLHWFYMAQAPVLARGGVGLSASGSRSRSRAPTRSRSSTRRSATRPAAVRKSAIRMYRGSGKRRQMCRR